jgi:hypothetical protein
MKSYKDYGYAPAQNVKPRGEHSDVLTSFAKDEETCIQKAFNSKQEAQRARNSLYSTIHNRGLNMKVYMRGHSIYIVKEEENEI